jgi:hypothetical protein
LETVAALSIVQENMELAVHLFGATENFYDQFRFLMSPLERNHHEYNINAARTALGEEAFSAAWAAGKSMSMDGAIQLASQEQS